MNNQRRVALWLVIDVLVTALIAWAGQKWIPGFDIRGPFLLMSPFYAASLFIGLASLLMHAGDSGGESAGADGNQIRSIAFEFGFNEVVIEKEQGKDGPLFALKHGGKTVRLPANWNKLSVEERRFAVAQTLAPTQTSFLKRLGQRLPWDIARLVSMVLAALNLWLVLVCHAAMALWIAYATFCLSERQVRKSDAIALRLTRNLKAAISCVKSDPKNDGHIIKADRRVTALKREAARLGIA